MMRVPKQKKRLRFGDTLKALICGACLLVTAYPSAARTPDGGTPLENELQDVIDQFLDENPIAPGISACVICPALDLDWCGAAGTAAKRDTARMTPAHTFRIASNTKTYVAAAVLGLAEKGELSLSDPLSRHLPALYDSLLRSDGYDTDGITIAQVLSHTAGLGDHTDDSLFVRRVFEDTLHVWTPEEQIRCLVEWREPVGAPGELHLYSDSGYVILGTIVTAKTGMPLGPSVRGLLDFERLGLTATYWEYMEEPPPGAGPRAHQYFGETDVTAWHASFDLYGGGGIVTDSRELALFIRKLLEGEVLAEASSLETMMRTGRQPYRLGLMFFECDGIELYGHQGFWNTFTFHAPALDLTVAGSILNHDATNGRELALRLVRAIAAARRER